MEELQECLKAKRKVNDIDLKIYELRALVFSPKNQIITDMPRAKGNNANTVERYLIKLERLESQKSDILNYQFQQWKEALRKVPNINNEEKQLLYIRFIEGKSWGKCATELNDMYGNWNVNKAFRIYRKILNSTEK